MQLKLIRKLGNAKFTEGRLYIDGVFECFTVEDTDRGLEHGGTKIAGLTAIPKGIYNVVITMSNRFKKLMPEVQNVPGFSGIRIHSGNKSADTEGCIIVGVVNTSMDDDWVSSSVIAMLRLQPKIAKAIKAGKTVTLEIV